MWAALVIVSGICGIITGIFLKKRDYLWTAWLCSLGGVAIAFGIIAAIWGFMMALLVLIIGIVVFIVVCVALMLCVSPFES